MRVERPPWSNQTNTDDYPTRQPAKYEAHQAVLLASRKAVSSKEGIRDLHVRALLGHRLQVDTATALGVRNVVDLRVQRLVVEADGRVAGIVAREYGTNVAVWARRGVVLATGSFAYNEPMVARYAPRIAGRPRPPSRSTTVCDPDGAGARR